MRRGASLSARQTRSLSHRPTVVSRQRKLVAAGAVLGGGLALALLFRRPAEPAPPPVAIEVAHSLVAAPAGLATPADAWTLQGQLSPQPPVPASTASLTLGSGPPSAGLPAASEALSATIAPQSSQALSHDPLPDAPNHGALAASGPAPPEAGPGAADAPPVPLGEQPAYRSYVIHEGDSLERLAERYLGDGSRALELFDLNRDVLENPHLLPIGGELRIPRSEDAAE